MKNSGARRSCAARSWQVKRSVALAAVGIVLLSGCKVKLDVATEVGADGSGSFEVAVVLSDDVRQALATGGLKTEDPRELAEMRERGEDIFVRLPDPLDVLERDVPAGWNARQVESEGLAGVALQRDFDDVSDIPNLIEALASWGDDVAERVGAGDLGIHMLARDLSVERDGPVFTLSGNPSAERFAPPSSGEETVEVELTVSVRLPGGVREHDADEERGGTLVWRIVPGESRGISATSDLTYDPVEIPWTLIGVIASAVLIGGLLAFGYVRQRRRADDEEPPGPDTLAERSPEPV